MTGGGFVDVPLSSSGKKQKFTCIVFISTCLSATGCLLFGYDTGIVSGSMIFIKDEFHLNSMWQELEVSITIIAACIFSCLSGPSSARFGRKKIILSAALIFCIGSIIMAVAWEKYSLLVGRFIAGAGIGFASTVVPCYIAETAPTHIRGSLVTMSYVFIVLGQMIAAVVAGLFSFLPHHIGWRYMLGVAAVPAGIQFIGFIFMPESPRWLVQRKRYEEAVAVLQRIRASEDVKEEFQNIKRECEEAEKQTKKSCLSLLGEAFAERGTRRALIVGSVLWITHEFGGINTMMYYTATIVQMAGVYDKSKAVWYAAAIDLIYTFFTGLGIYLVEKMGRRRLLMTSLLGTIISLGLIGAGFMIGENTAPDVTIYANNTRGCNLYASCQSCTFDPNCGFCFFDGTGDNPLWPGACLPSDESTEGGQSLVGSCNHGTVLREEVNTVWAYDWCPSKLSWIVIFGSILYLSFFGPGIGAMTWTVNSEIFPLHCRSACTAFTMGINWFSQTIVTLTFLTLTETIGKAGTFWLYGAFALIGGIFLLLTLPETKGRSLEETSKLFNKSWIVAFK